MAWPVACSRTGVREAHSSITQLLRRAVRPGSCRAEAAEALPARAWARAWPRAPAFPALPPALPRCRARLPRHTALLWELLISDRESSAAPRRALRGAAGRSGAQRELRASRWWGQGAGAATLGVGWGCSTTPRHAAAVAVPPLPAVSNPVATLHNTELHTL